MLIIGITGTFGSGKGTIAKYLVKQKGFKHFSVRGYLSEILKTKGMKVTRDNLVNLANKLRSKFGPNYLVEELYKKAKKINSNSVIESLRNVGEIEALRKKGGFYLFATDADPQIRYKRIRKRNQGKIDSISFKRFIRNENREMTSKDPNKQNLSACISMADYVFENNGNLTELYNKVETVLNEITS